MEFEGRARLREQLNLTPLIDCVFLLLLFFMVTSSFRQEEAVTLDLPDSSTATATEAATIEVSLAADGRVFLDGESILVEAVGAAVAGRLARDAGLTVAVRSDAGAEVQPLLSLLDEIRGVGATRVAIVTEPASPRP